MKCAKKNKHKIIIILMALLLPLVGTAETLNSSHYQVVNPEFGNGGNASNSTNYKSADELGGSGTTSAASTNYNLFPGFVLPVYPNVPNAPTFTNTGGNLYNALDFVVQQDFNASDVNYAIAISTTSNFASTGYVQANDTIGTTTVWQNYIAWGGGSGQRIVQLAPNTTYYLKVKARYGANSETAFSPVSSAATVNPTLTFTVGGVSSGSSVAGATTNVSTSSNAVTFPTLQTGSIDIAAQTLSVSTNATGGYTVTIQQNHDLQKTNGTVIPAVAATNASPAAWPTGITKARFGYHTTAATLCTGNTARFSANDTFAALSTSPFEVACNTGAVTADQTSLLYKVEIEALQPPGTYVNQITYIVTAQY